MDAIASPHLRSRSNAGSEARSLRGRDPSDPVRQTVEVAQRGRMILDVAEADLEASEARLGAFHETTWFFRNALAEARQAWDRLRAEYGSRALDAALMQPPVVVLTLGGGAGNQPTAKLVPIVGKTYRVERVLGTELAPVQFRLTCLPLSENGPYYVCRLQDGQVQCDCGEWIYRNADTPDPSLCKHLAALMALGWL